jgi:hypothetical protein
VFQKNTNHAASIFDIEKYSAFAAIIPFFEQGCSLKHGSHFKHIAAIKKPISNIFHDN